MLIRNALVYTENHRFEKRDLRIVGDRIDGSEADRITGSPEAPEEENRDAAAEEGIDAEGLYALPGLVDIHLHGAAGFDLFDADPASIRRIAEFEAQNGITAFCPAAMTCGEEKLKEILDSGELGRVNIITVNFGSFKEYDMSNRFFNRNLAGGAMLDIGVYALSLIRWFMRTDPERMVSDVRPAPTGVDEQATMLLSNEEGQMAAVALSLHSKQPKRAMISCEKGYIEIMEFPRAWEARITDAVSGDVRTVRIGEHADALKYELEDFEAAVRNGEDRLHLDLTEDVMELMTKARKAWGLTYPEEE